MRLQPHTRFCLITFFTAAFPIPIIAQFPAISDLRDFTTEQGVTFFGMDQLTALGCQAAAGDINGDGISDLIVPAAFSGLNELNPGLVFVILGGSPVMSTRVIDVSMLAPPDGFIIKSSVDAGLLGNYVVSGFDFDGDGIDDIALSSPLAAPDGGIRRGALYVLFGSPTIGASGIVDVENLTPGEGFRILGRADLDLLGFALSCGWRPLLDYNNDGFSDLVVSAEGADAPGRPNAGQTYIIFGGPNVGKSGLFDVDTLDGNNGLTVNGPFSGSRLVDGRIIGDVNGDGFYDLAWGLAFLDALGRQEAGHTYILFGGSQPDVNGFINIDDIPGSKGFVIYGSEAFHQNGVDIQFMGDVNGDGFDDIYTKGSLARTPRIVFGGPHLDSLTFFDLATLDGENGFLVGFTQFTEFYCAPGDIDGDGFAELSKIRPNTIVDGRRSAGESAIGYGGPTVGIGGIFQFPSPEPTDVDWFEVWGAELGHVAQVSQRLPDLNGDGIDEFIVRARLDQADGSPGDGGYVVFGQRRFAQGDFDQDHDVDAGDFADFVYCFNGSGRPPAAACTIGVRADFDRDGDVDLSDFATFSLNYTGAR